MDKLTVDELHMLIDALSYYYEDRQSFSFLNHKQELKFDGLYAKLHAELKAKDAAHANCAHCNARLYPQVEGAFKAWYCSPGCAGG